MVAKANDRKCRASTPQLAKKKLRKNVATAKLSFGVDDEEVERESGTSGRLTPRSSTLNGRSANGGTPAAEKEEVLVKKRFGPNLDVGGMPRIKTKAVLLREAQTREQLRKEFLAMQEAVRATEIAIPFVFYDGTNIPGGVCKVKKGDHIWLYLDRARKVGVKQGVGGDRPKRGWARVGVDDLILVRGEIIIPQVGGEASCYFQIC